MGGMLNRCKRKSRNGGGSASRDPVVHRVPLKKSRVIAVTCHGSCLIYSSDVSCSHLSLSQPGDGCGDKDSGSVTPRNIVTSRNIVTRWKSLVCLLLLSLWTVRKSGRQIISRCPLSLFPAKGLFSPSGP